MQEGQILCKLRPAGSAGKNATSENYERMRIFLPGYPKKVSEILKDNFLSVLTFK